MWCLQRGGEVLASPYGTQERPGQCLGPHREATVFMQPAAGPTTELGWQGHCSFQLQRGLGGARTPVGWGHWGPSLPLLPLKDFSSSGHVLLSDGETGLWGPPLLPHTLETSELRPRMTRRLPSCSCLNGRVFQLCLLLWLLSHLSWVLCVNKCAHAWECVRGGVYTGLQRRGGSGCALGPAHMLSMEPSLCRLSPLAPFLSLKC